MDKTWKAAERRIAELLGGKRVPITGRRGSDIRHEKFSIEVKHRRRVPALLRLAMEQATEAAKLEKLIPLVVLHQHRTDYEDSLVVMRISDFIHILNSHRR